MAVDQLANDWIAEHGLGRALWFARQNHDADLNLDRFVADQPGTPEETLLHVFGVALAAIAAGAAVRAIGAVGTTATARPPMDPTVPVGEWRYRFTVRFDPRIGYPLLRSAFRSHVEDYDHVLSDAEIAAIEEQLLALWRSQYVFDNERYGASFTIESVTVGPGTLP